MKNLFALFLFLTISGCLSSKGAHEHYEECEGSASSFRELVSCGKEKRMSECKPNGTCSKMGNRLVRILDTLSDQVASGEISESKAKLKYYDYIDRYDKEARRMEAAKWDALSDSLDDLADSYRAPTTCFSSGSMNSYGSYGSYSGSTTCY